MIRWLKNDNRNRVSYSDFDIEKAMAIHAFHRSMPFYMPTSLYALDYLARHLGVSGVYIKDESTRFGLNAFKSLGGTYCVAFCLAERIGLGANWDYEKIIRNLSVKPVFATATDGNHGRGIAYASRLFGCKCHVYLPKGSANERVDNIRREGAETFVTDCSYDETVLMIARKAQEEGWMLVQDTAWEGYTEIPARIMQGYLTMGDEIREQISVTPTHIFLQAGVGSMAASLCAYFRFLYGEKVMISVVEASEADCLYETAKVNDGLLHATKGSMQTMMAGLCCGFPCLTAWEMLKNQADFFLTLDDDDAATGMRTLAYPYPGDPVLESGESGASAIGAVIQILRQYPEAKDALGLGQNSVVLCISTEGATDRENYQRIVREGGECLDADRGQF